MSLPNLSTFVQTWPMSKSHRFRTGFCRFWLVPNRSKSPQSLPTPGANWLNLVLDPNSSAGVGKSSTESGPDSAKSVRRRPGLTRFGDGIALHHKLLGTRSAAPIDQHSVLQSPSLERRSGLLQVRSADQTAQMHTTALFGQCPEMRLKLALSRPTKVDFGSNPANIGEMRSSSVQMWSKTQQTLVDVNQSVEPENRRRSNSAQIWLKSSRL